MALSQSEAKEVIADILWPPFRAERERLNRIDRWWRWDHDRPHQPRHATNEYRELSARAQTPWLGHVVTSVAQSLYVDGYRRKGEQGNAKQWRWWQANGMDARQVPIHRAALGYGYAYELVLPGVNDFGEKMPVMEGVSPRNMIALYRKPARDDWPHYAMRAEPAKVNGATGWKLELYDDERAFHFNADSGGSSLEYIEFREHGLGVCPVVRFANGLDLEGRTPGEVEPFIPIAGRIDQTTFDRLVVQRFASWVVRTIAGMAQPETEAAAAAKKLLLKVEDLLIAEDKDTKFGSLPATPLDGFIAAGEADIKVLAAVTQTPAHEMLGTIANLSAEALAAARASKRDKVEERKLPFGESHEQAFRLGGLCMDDMDAARDVESQVRWRDTEIRSLAQAADALGKLAQMLSVPVEILWEKIPGWTDTDVQNAKAIAAEGDSLGALTRLLDRQDEPAPVGA